MDEDCEHRVESASQSFDLGGAGARRPLQTRPSGLSGPACLLVLEHDIDLQADSTSLSPRKDSLAVTIHSKTFAQRQASGMYVVGLGRGDVHHYS